MTEIPWNTLDLLEAYEHKIYCRVRQTGTSVLLRLQNGEDPRNVFTPSGLPRCPPYPLCCRLSDLGELGPGKSAFYIGDSLRFPAKFFPGKTRVATALLAPHMFTGGTRHYHQFTISEAVCSGIPLLFQFIKFLMVVSALNGLLSLGVVIAVYSNRAADALTSCSTFNNGTHVASSCSFLG